MQSFYPYSTLPHFEDHKIVAEIDTEALVENYRKLCLLTPNVRHICVVKAEAYGHVCRICVPALLKEGCDFFAVSCIEEALDVRRICREERAEADILILGYTDPAQAPALAEHDIIQTALSEAYTLSLALSAKSAACRVRVHFALDTGMNRIGFCARSDRECEDATEIIEKLCSAHDTLIPEGIFTHFARAEEEDAVPTRIQYRHFMSVKSALAKKGIHLFSHACNSAATVRFSDFTLDGVRLGILLYGVSPGGVIKNPCRPVMSLHTVISHIHDLPFGEVGYGGSYKTAAPRRIATLPIGYADGFWRVFSGCSVTVRNHEGRSFDAPVVGRICMDQCMIDVTDLPVSSGDSVEIFGQDPCRLTKLAALADTIEYEILCLVSARVPRTKKHAYSKREDLPK